MKLRGRIDPQATVKIKIHDTFNVLLRPLPRHMTQQLAQHNTRKERDPITGRINDTLDNTAFFRARLDHIFAGAVGLTPEIFLTLTQLPDDVEVDLPDLDGDGFISCDARRTVWTDPQSKIDYNIFEFLWDKIDPGKFSRIVEATLEEYEQALKVESEKKSMTS
jgi:hypothetical protein